MSGLSELLLSISSPQEELDFSSTFVSKARRKVDAQSVLPKKEKGGKNPRERKAEKKQKAEVRTRVLIPGQVLSSPLF